MKREIRLKARDLRQQGHSIGDIALMLSLSKSTVSVWVRDIELTSLQVERLKEKNRSYGAQNKGAGTNRSNGRSQRIAFQEQGRLKAREGRPLHLAGCRLGAGLRRLCVGRFVFQRAPKGLAAAGSGGAAPENHAGADR